LSVYGPLNDANNNQFSFRSQFKLHLNSRLPPPPPQSTTRHWSMWKRQQATWVPTAEYVPLEEFTFSFGGDGFYVAVSRVLYLWKHVPSLSLSHFISKFSSQNTKTNYVVMVTWSSFMQTSANLFYFLLYCYDCQVKPVATWNFILEYVDVFRYIQNLAFFLLF
jgi:hypothetical protein